MSTPSFPPPSASTPSKSCSPVETPKRPELVETIENVGQGTMMAMQNPRMLGAAQINGDGRMRTYAWICEAESWTSPSDPVEAKAILKAHFSSWPQWMLNLIAHCDAAAIYQRAL